jgi:hypothetical protein
MAKTPNGNNSISVMMGSGSRVLDSLAGAEADRLAFAAEEEKKILAQMAAEVNSLHPSVSLANNAEFQATRARALQLLAQYNPAIETAYAASVAEFEATLAAARLSLDVRRLPEYTRLLEAEQAALARIRNAGTGWRLPGPGLAADKLRYFTAQVESEIAVIQFDIIRLARASDTGLRLPIVEVAQSAMPMRLRALNISMAERLRLYTEFFNGNATIAEIEIAERAVRLTAEEMAALHARYDAHTLEQARRLAAEFRPERYQSIVNYERELAQRLIDAREGRMLSGPGTPAERFDRLKALVERSRAQLAEDIRALALQTRPLNYNTGILRLPQGMVTATTSFEEHVLMRVNRFGEPAEIAALNVFRTSGQLPLEPESIMKTRLKAWLAAQITPRAVFLLGILKFLGYVGIVYEIYAFAEFLHNMNKMEYAIDKLEFVLRGLNEQQMSAHTCHVLQTKMSVTVPLVVSMRIKYFSLLGTSGPGPDSRAARTRYVFRNIDRYMKSINDKITASCTSLECIARIEAIINHCVLPCSGALSIAIDRTRDGRNMFWSDVSAVGRILEAAIGDYVTQQTDLLYEYRAHLNLGLITPVELNHRVTAMIRAASFRTSRLLNPLDSGRVEVAASSTGATRVTALRLYDSFTVKYRAILDDLLASLGACPPPRVTVFLPKVLNSGLGTLRWSLTLQLQTSALGFENVIMEGIHDAPWIRENGHFRSDLNFGNSGAFQLTPTRDVDGVLTGGEIYVHALPTPSSAVVVQWTIPASYFTGTHVVTVPYTFSGPVEYDGEVRIKVLVAEPVLTLYFTP